MSDGTPTDCVQFPCPNYQVHRDNSDLANAANAAHELAVRANMLVYWLRDCDWSLHGSLAPDEVLGNLLEEIDGRAPRCAELNQPLYQELAAAGGGYSDGSLHGCCAAEAALRYAGCVRANLDFAARVASGRLADGHLPGQHLPGEDLRGRWEAIVACYRTHSIAEHLRRGLAELPPLAPLLNRLAVDVFKVVDTRLARKTHVRLEAAPLPLPTPHASFAPFVPLTSWDEIIAALNEPHHGKAVWKNDAPTRGKIRTLNERHSGPIVMPAKPGGQPRVAKDALMKWWDGLREDFENRTEEAERNAASVDASTRETYLHGRSEIVAPEINGHVKKLK